MDFANARLGNESADDDTSPHKKCLSLEARHSKAIESARRIRLNLKPSIFIPKLPEKSAKYPWISATKGPKIPQTPSKPSNHRTSQIIEDPRLMIKLQRVKRKFKRNHNKKETKLNKSKPGKLEEYRKLLLKVASRNGIKTKMRTFENKCESKALEDALLTDHTIEETLKNMGLEITTTEEEEAERATVTETAGGILQSLSSKEAHADRRSLIEYTKDLARTEIINLDCSVEEILPTEEEILPILPTDERRTPPPLAHSEIIDLDCSVEEIHQREERRTEEEILPTEEHGIPPLAHTEIIDLDCSVEEILSTEEEVLPILPTEEHRIPPLTHSEIINLDYSVEKIHPTPPPLAHSKIIDLDCSVEEIHSTDERRTEEEILPTAEHRIPPMAHSEIINLNCSVEEIHPTDERRTPPLEAMAEDNCRNQTPPNPPPSPYHTEITRNVHRYNEALHWVREFQDILKMSHSDFTSTLDQGIFGDLRAIQDSINDFSMFLHNTYMEIELFELEQSQILRNFEAKNPSPSQTPQETAVPSEFVVRIDVPEMPGQIITFQANEIMQCSQENYEKSEGDREKSVEFPQARTETVVQETFANSSKPLPIPSHEGPTNNAEHFENETPTIYHSSPRPQHLPSAGDQSQVPTHTGYKPGPQMSTYVHPAYRSEAITSSDAQNSSIPNRHQHQIPSPRIANTTNGDEVATTSQANASTRHSAGHPSTQSPQTLRGTNVHPAYTTNGSEVATTSQASAISRHLLGHPATQSPQMHIGTNVHPAYTTNGSEVAQANASSRHLLGHPATQSPQMHIGTNVHPAGTSNGQNTSDPKHHDQDPTPKETPQATYAHTTYRNETVPANIVQHPPVPAHQSHYPNPKGYNNNQQMPTESNIHPAYRNETMSRQPTPNGQSLPMPAQQSPIPGHTGYNHNPQIHTNIEQMSRESNMHPAYRNETMSRQPTPNDQSLQMPAQQSPISGHTGYNLNPQIRPNIQQMHTESNVQPTPNAQILPMPAHQSPIPVHTGYNNNPQIRNETMSLQPTPNAQLLPMPAHQSPIPVHTGYNIDRQIRSGPVISHPAYRSEIHHPHQACDSTPNAQISSVPKVDTHPYQQPPSEAQGNSEEPQTPPVSGHHTPAPTTPNPPNTLTVSKIIIKTIRDGSRKSGAKKRKVVNPQDNPQQQLKSRTKVAKHSKKKIEQQTVMMARPTVISRSDNENAQSTIITNSPAPECADGKENTFATATSAPYPIPTSIAREQFANSPPVTHSSLIASQSVDQRNMNFKMPTSLLPPRPPPAYPILHPAQMREHLANFHPAPSMPPQSADRPQNWVLRHTLLPPPRPSPPYQMHPSLGREYFMNPHPTTTTITTNPLLTPPQSVDRQPSPLCRPMPYYAYSGCDPSIGGVPMTPPSEDLVRHDGVPHQSPAIPMASFGVYNQDGRPYVFKETAYPPCPPAYWENNLPMSAVYNP